MNNVFLKPDNYFVIHEFTPSNEIGVPSIPTKFELKIPFDTKTIIGAYISVLSEPYNVGETEYGTITFWLNNKKDHAVHLPVNFNSIENPKQKIGFYKLDCNCIKNSIVNGVFYRNSNNAPVSSPIKLYLHISR